MDTDSDVTMADDGENDMGLKTLSNTNSVLEKIAILYAERLMADVTLVVGDKSYPAHRIILCASSDVFQAMLMNENWREFRETVIRLEEEEKCRAVFPQFLRYLYIGQMSISVDTAVYILKLADKYNIHDLVQICLNYMKLHVNKATAKGHFVEWLHNTMLIYPAQKYLKAQLENYLKWNLERVMSYPGWEQLSPCLMSWLLQQNDLVVRSEFRLYELVQVWFRYHRAQIESRHEMREQDREAAVKRLIYGVLVHIRFAMMSVPQLASVLMSSASVRMLKEFYVARVANGMSFHSRREEIVHNIQTSGPAGELQFTPRLYTSDLWSLEIVADCLHNVEKYSSIASVFFSPFSFIDLDEESNGWDVEFFPLGVRFKPAQLIGIFHASTNREIPECIIRTVRLRITCQTPLYIERRYMVGVLISATMNEEEYVRHCHVRVAYFSNDQRVLNIDNLIPFDQLVQQIGERWYSQYMVGEQKNMVKIKVVIVPLNKYSNVFASLTE